MLKKEDVKIQIDEIWAVNQKVVPGGGIGFSWSGNIGFGEYIITIDENGVPHADTEHMDRGEDKWFTNLILAEFAKKIIIDD